MRRQALKPQWPQKHEERKPLARQDGKGRNWLAAALNLSNFLPGLLAGFLLGLWLDIPGSVPKSRVLKPNSRRTSSSSSPAVDVSEGDEGELKMVFVVRQDLKMGAGKIASQCAHAAVGIYGDLMRSNRSLLSKWESSGQPKIVVTCKNQQEMNELKFKAEKLGLPALTIADAGRTQVAAGSKTVLVIGPGSKPVIDSVTRHLRLL